jgi:hypothetical protein
MKSLVKSDLILNIFLPLVGGVLIYLFTAISSNATWWIRSYIPDGLWAYAFASAMLIIWQRELNLFWLLLVLICGLFFEWMQFNDIVSGTGDLADIFVYILFFLIALFFNPFFKRTLKYQNT